MSAVVIFTFLILIAETFGQEGLHPLHLAAEIPLVHRGGISLTAARITGGDKALEGQFPYQAGLKIDLGGQSSFCGGTLISPQHVLTAAHCCEGAESIDVILGSIEIYNETEPNRVSMTVPKSDVKIHEHWDSSKLLNDICMLKLSKEVALSDYIQVADLPEDDSTDYRDEVVIASGWGRDSDRVETISSALKFVKVKIIKNSICNLMYMGSIKDTNLCTSGAGGKSTCNGDSGGPLVLDGGQTVVGVTSFGISFGCEVGWPAVFTRVSRYLGWIKDNMS